MCCGAWRQRLRCVTLLARDSHLAKGCSDNPIYFSDLHLVARICEDYPRMAVQWHADLGQQPRVNSTTGVNDFHANVLPLIRVLRPEPPITFERHMKESRLSTERAAL